jgi:hypothetical protein
MHRESGIPLRLVSPLIRRITGSPAWIMALFILLVCLVPFAGGTSPFRGDVFNVLDPFSFSLLTPAQRAFGPHSMLALAGLLIIPAVLIHWRQLEAHMCEVATHGYASLRGGALPIASFLLYCLFLVLSVPLIARSSAFPGTGALAIALLDLVLLAVMMSWGVDFALSLATRPRLMPIVGWIVAGSLHLARTMTDAFLVAPDVRQLIEADWTSVALHGVLAAAAVTLHALPRSLRYMWHTQREAMCVHP